jgi:antitoxin MazE
MRVQIQKWGNSLAMRIPKPFAADLHVAAGSIVELTVLKGRLVVTPLAEEERVQLASLLRRVTKRNQHGEVDTGASVGREPW